MRWAMQTGGTYQQVKDAATWAEHRGLDAFALADHYLAGGKGEALAKPAPDSFAYLAGLAEMTEKIPLVVLVAPITFRHPAVLAKLAMSIGEMSDGRFTLGVGTGWMDEEHELFGIPYPDMSERFELLEEALGYLQAAFADEPSSFAGAHYRLSAFPMNPRPERRIPLMVGGSGLHKTPRLAGTYCDEFNVYASQPDRMAQQIERARQAANDAGRDPDAILFSSASPVLAGVDHAAFRRRVDRMSEARSMPVDEIDKWLDGSLIPHGTPDQVAEIVGRLTALGVERFYVQERFGSDDTEELFVLLEQATAPSRR